MQSMQITAPELSPPDGRDFWIPEEDDGRRHPYFTTREVSVVFFGRTKLWLHRKIAAGMHVLDGELIIIPRSQSGYYQFGLEHVEKLLHSFFSQGLIPLATFENGMIIMKAIANNHRMI